MLADVLRVDPWPLVTAQQAAFAPIFAAMAAEPVPTDPVARWRHEHAQAVERFLAGLAAKAPGAAGVGPTAMVAD